MSTSKKHYEATAKLLRERFETFRVFADCKENVPVSVCKAEFANVMIGMANIFADDNRNFDRKKFYADCVRLTDWELLRRDLDKVEF